MCANTDPKGSIDLLVGSGMAILVAPLRERYTYFIAGVNPRLPSLFRISALMVSGHIPNNVYREMEKIALEFFRAQDLSPSSRMSY